MQSAYRCFYLGRQQHDIIIDVFVGAFTELRG
jgi:hypothetical protein